LVLVFTKEIAMDVYNVGVEEPWDLPSDGYVWLVYSYDVYSQYEGGGEAIGLSEEDGMLYIYNLGHCSCYGPFDSVCVSMTVEEYLRPKDSVHDFDPKSDVDKKVRELLAK
jgi:hypothetical protein